MTTLAALLWGAAVGLLTVTLWPRHPAAPPRRLALEEEDGGPRTLH